MVDKLLNGHTVAPLNPLLAKVLTDIRRTDWYDIGYPRGIDLPIPQLAEILVELRANNVGDPWEIGHVLHHTKTVEQLVVQQVGRLIEAPSTRWGFVASSSSAAIEHAILQARLTYPDVIVYASKAAHPCLTMSATKLAVPIVAIRTNKTGQMDVDDLKGELSRRRDCAAFILATLGTTGSEAIDDLAAISEVCDELAMERLFVHADAALSGIPLALTPADARPAATFAQAPRLTSWSTSGHKFLSTGQPCAVLVYAEHPSGRRKHIVYTGTDDSTACCSRSAHMPIVLWHQLTRLNWVGHRARAQAARDLATYTHQRLQQLGWPSSLNPLAFTVVLRKPPRSVLKRWSLALIGQELAHIVCMPGIHQAQIDDFIESLRVSCDDLGKLMPDAAHPPMTNAKARW